MNFIIQSRLFLLMEMIVFSLIAPLHASVFRKMTPYVQSFSNNALKTRISFDDKRFITLNYVLRLMHERDVKTIVETGTARNGECNCQGDGCSTPIWGTWAQEHDAYVYSVDIDPDAIQCSATACSAYQNCISFIVSDSVEFLASFKEPIDFLYLDSYDFDYSNPGPSQEHHLKEIVAAYPRLHKKSIIMIDDCDLPFGGKGKLAIQYLLDKGWKVALSAYQVVLVYPERSVFISF